MPSPFPGMDPYIEQPSLWGDFYINLAVEIRTQLNSCLRPHYFARVGSSPLSFPFGQRSVEIYSVMDQKLITVIDILSPLNKLVDHDAHTQYSQDRIQLLTTNKVHLLEIDLLREGQCLSLPQPVPAAAYYIILSRAEATPRVKVWPIQLHDPLPVVDVPLRQPDPDVLLDLGSAVAAVYDLGAYDVQLDYQNAPPLPKLSEEQTRWVQQPLQPLRK
ncbi:MAG: DUF4058 family protein [Caldilineaceae bacterium]